MYYNVFRYNNVKLVIYTKGFLIEISNKLLRKTIGHTTFIENSSD